MDVFVHPSSFDLLVMPGWVDFNPLGADVLSKGVSSSGVKEPPSVEEGDYQTLDRLKVSTGSIGRTYQGGFGRIGSLNLNDKILHVWQMPKRGVGRAHKRR